MLKKICNFYLAGTAFRRSAGDHSAGFAWSHFLRRIPSSTGGKDKDLAGRQGARANFPPVSFSLAPASAGVQVDVAPFGRI